MSAESVTGVWAVYRRLLGYTGKYRVFLILAFVGMIVEALAAGAFTALMKPMVDQTFVAKNPEVRWVLPLSILGLFVLRGIATFVTDYGMARTGRSVVLDLRQQILDKFLRMPSERFDQEPIPALVSRLNYDTDQVSQATSEAIKIAVTDTLTILVMIGVMLMQSVKVTLAVLVIAPIIGFISSKVGKRYRRINRGIQDGVGKMAQAAEEALSAQHEVKIYGMQDAERRRYAGLARSNLGMHLKVEATKATASATVQILAAAALAVILVVAGQEAMQGRMTAGAFVTLMTSMMVLLPSLKRITNVQSIIQRGVAASDRLFAILDQSDEPDTGRRGLERAVGEIRFEAVSVRYAQNGKAALSEISFTAKPGTVTAIVGRSGSGKTSLIRLIPRFYEPSVGQILLDGIDIRELKLADLRRQIALVSQQVMLFDDSVMANVRFGKAGASDAEVWDALRSANAEEFVLKLPDSVNTAIGERGGRLSGGQKQRLAIARAILKDAPILILDEATAALDNESERLVQDALAHLIPDRTTLIIAHRLSTVEHADQVLVLDEGRLAEVGTHAELLQRGGLYSHLHQMQFRDADGA
ncbi:MAG: lipid A export permease/ATP-binding protein MsbA [Xanthomonadaceae bacterium]|jgi:subfamily B ATP-binding cassette protein MsbA|nr:lipid A export permease/ATP-binding protein MsbA [Xanthomonadaceae bacterium]